MFNFLFIVKWYFFGRLKIGRKSRKKNAFAEFNRALSNLNKGSYVIDCVSNVGEFTKLFLEKFGLNSLSDMPKLKEVSEIIESDPSLGEQITAFEDKNIKNEKIGDEEVSDAVE